MHFHDQGFEINTQSSILFFVLVGLLVHGMSLDMGGLLDVGRSACVGNAIIHHQVLSPWPRPVKRVSPCLLSSAIMRPRPESTAWKPVA